MEAKVGVSVIILNKRGEVLVGKRKGSHGEGMLSVPGGHLDFGELLVTACDRELMEEIGISFDGKYESIGFSEDFFNEPTYTKHYITHYFVASDIDSDTLNVQNLEPHKCESWDWVHYTELPNNMFCDTYKFIMDYCKTKYPSPSLIVDLKATVRDVVDFPKAGILFRDITPVLANTKLCNEIVDALVLKYKGQKIDAIAGIESRGFFFGFLLANKLGVPFIPVRKAGKLPYKTVKIEYSLEYGSATIEMNSDAVTSGMRVLIHDDLLATGGTAEAAAELISGQGGIIAGFTFIITLADLGGYKKLSKYTDNIFELLSYSDIKNDEQIITVPNTLEEAFQELNNAEGISIFANETEDDIIGYHHSLGRVLRNEWGLWGGTNALCKFFNSVGIKHADDMSSIILTSFHRYLNNKEIKLDEQLLYYWKFWYEQNDVNYLPTNISGISPEYLKLYHDKITR